MLMGDIKEYILSKKIRSFVAKLGIIELITDRHVLMVTATKRAFKSDVEILSVLAPLMIDKVIVHCER